MNSACRTPMLAALRDSRVLLAAVCVLLSCVEAPPPLEVADRGLRSDCQHSGNCRSGTRCLGRSSEPPACAVDGSTSGEATVEVQSVARSCRVPTPGGDQALRAALQTGFGVRGMDTTVDREGSPSVLSWNAPKGTTVVRCALFAGVPEFDLVGGSKTIVNFQKIALAVRDSDAHSVFQYQTTARREGAPPCIDCPGSSGYLVDRLLAGCWAYDTVDLIRASDLIPVDVREVADDMGLIVNKCGSTNGTTCFSEAGFGVCYQRACLKRCSTEQDCEPRQELLPLEDGGVPPLPACAFECKTVTDSVGGCVRRPVEGGEP